jgi:hypothetical protein
MYREPDELIGRLQHEKTVWRAIAIGLGLTLLLLLVVGAVFSVAMFHRSGVQAMRAEEAMMQAEQERHRAEAVQQEAAEQARRAAKKQKNAEP